MSSQLTAAKPSREPQSYDVVVIGGGLSGVSAARHLLRSDNTLTVLVLEANDRVGGRTLTAAMPLEQSDTGKHRVNVAASEEIASTTLHTKATHVVHSHSPSPSTSAPTGSGPQVSVTIDLGGQWIGPTQTAVCALVDELGVARHKQFHAGKKILDLQGRVSSYASDIPTGVGLLGLLDVQLLLWRFDRMMKSVPTDNPHSCPHAAEWDATSVQSAIDTMSFLSSTKAMVRMLTHVAFGAEPADLSLLDFLWYGRCAGGIDTLLNIENGYQQWVLVGGSQQLSVGLANKVSHDFNGRGRILLGTRVTAIQQTEGAVTVQCTSTAGGAATAVSAKHVIVAMPPVQANRIHYSPPLPASRAWLMSRNFLGSLTKTIVFFQTQFWIEDGFSGEALSDSVCACFDDSMPRSDGSIQPALVLFVGGDLARQWTLLSQEERFERVVSRIERWFGKDKVRTQITGIIEKEWGRDPHTMGCPAGIWSTGSLWSVGPALREPCGRLFWAGTETSTEAQGFLEGAIRAGERAANEVLAAAAGKGPESVVPGSATGSLSSALKGYDSRVIRPSQVQDALVTVPAWKDWVSSSAALLTIGAGAFLAYRYLKR